MQAPLVAALCVMGVGTMVAVGAALMSTMERRPQMKQSMVASSDAAEPPPAAPPAAAPPPAAPPAAAPPPAVPPAAAPPAAEPPAAAPPALQVPTPPTDDDPLPQQIPQLSDAGLPVVRLTLGGESFDLELAATDAAITKGLSGRDRVRRHRGMLFVMPYARDLGFWMVDCLVPIDIAYADERGIVTGVHAMKVEPPQRADESRGAYEVRLPRYPSGAKARYAIELAAGECARLGISKGSELRVDWQAVNALAKATRIAGSRR